MGYSEDPTIPLLGIHLNDVPLYHKGTCSSVFIAALFVMARNWKKILDVSQEKCGISTKWNSDLALKNKDILKFVSK